MSKPKLLFLVHAEEIFRRFMPEDFDSLIHEAWDEYDKIIVLDSEINNDVIHAAKSVASETWGWGWGYEPGQFYDPEDEGWVIPSSGHDYTWVPYELRKKIDWVKSHEVYIAGGADGECLQDWRDVLRCMDVPFSEVPELIF